MSKEVEEKSVRQIVTTMAGYISICWTLDGTFDSSKASAEVDKTVAALKELVMRQIPKENFDLDAYDYGWNACRAAIQKNLEERFR